MKIKTILCLFLSVIIGSGCKSLDQNSRTFIGIQTGSMIGNIAGTIIGDNIGGYTGAVIGSAIGTTTGAVTGAVITSPRRDKGTTRARSDAYGPELYIDQILLHDHNGNRIVETGEECKVTFMIVNEGKWDAVKVTPVIKGVKNTKGMKASETVTIERIKPDEFVEYTVTLTSDSRMKSGNAVFSIEVKELNGYGIPKEEFTIQTHRIK